MKIKRTMIGPGQYLITARDGLETLAQKVTRCTNLRVGPNKKAWEYGSLEGQIEGVAFDLRQVECLVLQEGLQVMAAKTSVS